MRILIVDDDPDMRETLSFVLNEHGYETTTAANGARALDVLRTNRSFCAILLDLMMPVMDGTEFLAQREREHAVAEIPVIVITAYGTSAERLPQVAEFLAKPLDLEHLVATLGRFCGGAEPRPHLRR